MTYLKYILLVILLPISLFSQELITDRPDQTESAAVVPKNSLQIEAGIVYEILEMNDASIENWDFPSALFRYGLLNILELRLGTSINSGTTNLSDTSESYKGMTDIELGAKIAIIDGNGILPQTAVIVYYNTLSGTSYVSSDEHSYGALVSLAKDINNNVSTGINVSWEGYEKSNSSMIKYSFVLGVSLGEKAGLYLENYGHSIEDEFRTSFDAGITYLISENVQYDFSFGTGINHQMNFISTGISIRLPE